MLYTNENRDLISRLSIIINDEMDELIIGQVVKNILSRTFMSRKKYTFTSFSFQVLYFIIDFHICYINILFIFIWITRLEREVKSVVRISHTRSTSLVKSHEFTLARFSNRLYFLSFFISRISPVHRIKNKQPDFASIAP